MFFGKDRPQSEPTRHADLGIKSPPDIWYRLITRPKCLSCRRSNFESVAASEAEQGDGAGHRARETADAQGVAEDRVHLGAQALVFSPCQGLPSAGVLGGRSSTLQRPAATQVCPPRAEVATPRSPVVPSSIPPSSPCLISTLSLTPPLTPLPPSQALGGIVDGLSSARFFLACGLFWELCGPKESPICKIARCICWVCRFCADLPHVCSCSVLQLRFVRVVR